MYAKFSVIDKTVKNLAKSRPHADLSVLLFLSSYIMFVEILSSQSTNNNTVHSILTRLIPAYIHTMNLSFVFRYART